MNQIEIYLQTTVAVSIFYVWVVRYKNIVQEFKEYGLPSWLRDLVGIFKLTFAALLLVGIDRPDVATVAAGGLSLLMVCAIGVHLHVKNPVSKMTPALALLLLACFIIWLHQQPLLDAGSSSVLNRAATLVTPENEASLHSCGGRKA